MLSHLVRVYRFSLVFDAGWNLHRHHTMPAVKGFADRSWWPGQGAGAGVMQQDCLPKSILGVSMRRPEIDEAILSYVSATWMKVAIVVVKVADESGVSFPDDEDDFELVAQHIELLVGEGRLLAQGNLKDWRHSEICKS